MAIAESARQWESRVRAAGQWPGNSPDCMLPYRIQEEPPTAGQFVRGARVEFESQP